MSAAKGPTSFTKYGNFSKDGTEFIIRRHDTPRPWINFLSNAEYGVCLSQTGGGYSFFLDPGYARVTRWEPSNFLKNSPGRFFYLRDAKTGEYWSAHHQPVGRSDTFRCRHGLGYTTIQSTCSGIQTTATHYVPLQGLREVWHLAVKNTGTKPRTLDLFPTIEWHLGEWEQELKMRNMLILLNRGKYDHEHQILMGNKNPVCNRPWPWTAFMFSTLKAKAFEMSYEKFMGRYRSYVNPLAVEKGKLSNSEMLGGNMVGVLQHRVVLKAGEQIEFSVVIGAEKDENLIAKLADEYRQTTKAREELVAVRRHWRSLILDNFKVETPDPLFDTFVNVWNKYQVVMNNHWGRGVSFYHEGWGEFGYRNTAQDAMGILPLDPGFARTQLIKLARHQRQNGQPLPGWSLIMGTNDGRPPSDFPMWLPMLLLRYLKETGDRDILNLKIDYYDGGSDSLYQHAVKANRFLQDIAKSERGLPLMGTQDWNDAYDRVGIEGRGESIWLGMGLCFALQNMEELACFVGDREVAEESRVRYIKQKDLINRLTWDGDWYLYATNDYGEPIGSKTNAEGAIQLNPQTWAIMAGIAEGERLQKVLQTIDERLATPYGPVLFKPAYSHYDGRVGRITSFVPGTKENAAIFCHGGAFKIFADLKLRRGEEAYRSFKALMPCAENKDIEIYKTEPYVYAEYLVGPENPHYGEGAHTWLTGTADWTLFCAAEGILGVIPDFEGLRIDPCFPRHWGKARMTRNFRGATYVIDITNPQKITHGVKSITVDGRPLSGNVIPPHQDGQVHQVRVVMGKN